MSHSKREQNPIARTLSEFRQVATLLNNEGLIVTESNYKKVQALLNRYQELASFFDQNRNGLNGKQIGELNQIRLIISREERREIRKNVTSVENGIKNREKKIKEEYTRIEKQQDKAREVVKVLWPQLQEVAKKFINSGIANMDELLRKYKDLRNELSIQVSNLPTQERKQKIQEMAELSQLVNKHESKLYEEMNRARKVIEAAVTQAQKNVNSMSLLQMVQRMLPELEREEILKIAQKAGILPLQDKIATENGANLDKLVVREQPLEKQTALISVILKELALNGSQSGPLAQYLQAVQENAKDLMSGKKTQFVLLYETKEGEIGGFYFNIRELLHNQHQAISRLIHEMYKRGVDQNSRVVMAFASPEQAASLMLANGENVKALTKDGNLQELTELLLENAGDSKALARIVGHDVAIDEKTLEIIRDLKHSKEQNGIEPTEVMKLFQVIAVIFETRNILINWINAPVHLKEQTEEALLGAGKTPAIVGGKGNQAKRVRFLPDLVKKPTVTLSDTDQPAAKRKDEELLDKKIQVALEAVDQALEELKGKIGDINQHKYDKAYEAAKTLLRQLQETRDQYVVDLTNPQTNFNEAGLKFKEACKLVIQDAKPILEKDLGWGEYLKNLLKVLVNAIVFCVTFGANQGFFATTRAKSAVAVEEAESALELNQINSSQKFN
ncbi:TPA: Dot/Icm secretion system substrate [Legionella pneumophila]|uniref:Coiled-coil-containing protein n=3 Tax=Legionella pneumophila TaxID=446 RepID=A0AAX2IV54_LEGPN|nr:Dot/Icm secretion system substrate [Legionella pneumophila subsp. pascullei]HAT6915709.1 Dot/Icm secretion system substrate [Legionella pneumophila]AMP92571.1 Dot/Icm secretion system substrate [Legionella pneumophila subsp. pascullei]SQG90446.1 coiled-coil-containing protein [Legionella pneumophila subsp. pascullei]VEH06724.1 coiled-coil-containing protein [Legionella pneumophila subsp. pascullei]